MSVWHVNTAWTRFYPTDGGLVRWIDCSDVDSAIEIDTRDALSNPTVEDLEPAGLSLWPRGAAWGAPGAEAPGGDTVLARLTRAMLAPFAELYRRAWQLTLESRASSLVESLDDWERDYGLPDPCAPAAQTEAERRTALAARVARMATITPADIVRLAARLGYVVALHEPEPFRVGQTPLGSGRLSNVAMGQQWALHIFAAPIRRFRVGESRVGVDRLLDFEIGTLACAIRRIAPAWTLPVFSVASLPELMVLVTEDGATITTDDGRRIAVVVATMN